MSIPSENIDAHPPRVINIDSFERGNRGDNLAFNDMDEILQELTPVPPEVPNVYYDIHGLGASTPWESTIFHDILSEEDRSRGMGFYISDTGILQLVTREFVGNNGSDYWRGTNTGIPLFDMDDTENDSTKYNPEIQIVDDIFGNDSGISALTVNTEEGSRVYLLHTNGYGGVDIPVPVNLPEGFSPEDNLTVTSFQNLDFDPVDTNLMVSTDNGASYQTFVRQINIEGSIENYLNAAEGGHANAADENMPSINPVWGDPIADFSFVLSEGSTENLVLPEGGANSVMIIFGNDGVGQGVLDISNCTPGFYNCRNMVIFNSQFMATSNQIDLSGDFITGVNNAANELAEDTGISIDIVFLTDNSGTITWIANEAEGDADNDTGTIAFMRKALSGIASKFI